MQYIDIAASGCVGDGVTDNQTALQAVIDTADSQGKGIFVPDGQFNHSGDINLWCPMRGAGRDTAIVYASSAVNNRIKPFLPGGRLMEIDNVQIKSASTVRTGVDWPLFIDPVCTNFYVHDIMIDGGNSGGMIVFGAKNGHILRCLVKNTLADGIYTTNGATNIVVAECTTQDTGDDGISFVSFTGDPASVHNCLAQDNTVLRSSARGISCIGSSDITIQRNSITDTESAGIMVATETAFVSTALSNVHIRQNRVTRPATQTGGHGGIMVSADNNNITGVLIEDNFVTDPTNSSVKIEGVGPDQAINIAIRNNTYVDAEADGHTIVGNTVNVYCSGNKLNGSSYGSCSGIHNFSVPGSTLRYGFTPNVRAIPKHKMRNAA